MTTIVALVHQEAGFPDTVYMGGDSRLTHNWERIEASNPKVFERDKVLFGATGDLRLRYLLQFFPMPPLPDDLNLLDKYLNMDFVSALQTHFKATGFCEKESDEFGGCFMMGIQGRLFRINRDYCVQPIKESFHAIGSGSAYALGCLDVLGNRGTPENRVRRALATAARFDIGTGAPFHVISLGKE